MRVPVVVFALVIAVALLAGCGGSSSAVSTTNATGGQTNTPKGGGEAAEGEEKSGGASSKGSGAAGEGTASGTSEGGEAGNGGETKPSLKPRSGPLTKTEFVKEGDGICNNVTTAYQVKAIELREAAGKGQEPPTAEVNLKAAVPPLYVAMKEFEALTPPKGDEKKAEALIAALEKAAKGLEAKPESELAGPRSPFAEFQELTQAYGFQVCSEL